MTNEEKEKIIIKFTPLINSIIVKYHSSIHDLEFEDIRQEVLMHIAKKLDKYNPNKAKVSTYIMTISKNKLINMTKSKKNKKETPISFNEDMETKTLFSDDSIKDLGIDEVVNTLEEFKQGVIRMIMEGYTQTHVSKIVGLSRQRVNQIWFEFVEEYKNNYKGKGEWFNE